jgi:hypothetical protein
MERNTQYEPNQRVDDATRLSVYKEAIKFISRKNKGVKHPVYGVPPNAAGLCILLPCILWNTHYLADAPNGEIWDYRDTGEQFIELTDSDIKKITAQYSVGIKETLAKRIELLTKYVNKLEKKLAKKVAS